MTLIENAWNEVVEKPVNHGQAGSNGTPTNGMKRIRFLHPFKASRVLCGADSASLAALAEDPKAELRFEAQETLFREGDVAFIRALDGGRIWVTTSFVVLDGALEGQAFAEARVLI